MKKLLKLLGIIILSTLIGFVVSACDEGGGISENGNTHSHSYSSTYSKNETQHWKVCSCGDKIEVSNHTFIGGTCSVCNYYVVVPDPNRVATPITSIQAGIVSYGTEVKLGTTTVGATIYYTTDGSDPTIFSTVFSDSSTIKINTLTTIKAIATAQNMSVSSMMTATFTPTYTVTFNSNGGSEVNPITAVVHGNKITAPYEPYKLNNQFVSWNKAGPSSAWNFETDTVTSNITLTASWRVVAYIVTFETNGGTFIEPILVEPGNILNELPTPIKYGLDNQFVGWYRNETLTISIDSSYIVYSDMTLYAKWFNPSLTYNLGDIGPGGGKIFYRSESGFSMADTGEICHYLEAAPNDLDEYAPDDMKGKYRWFYENYSTIDNNEQEIGYGRSHTAKLTSRPASNYPAAAVCSAYSNNNLTDWFIPSLNELWMLYDNKSYVENINTGEYWSSTTTTTFSSSYHYAYYINFSNGVRSYVSYYRTEYYKVRPVRAF